MTPEEAWRALDQDVAEYLKRKGVVPSCRAGCFACCFGLVTLSRLEAEALLPHLTPFQKARLLEEGPRRLRLLREGKDDPRFPSRFFQSRTPCPLLHTPPRLSPRWGPQKRSPTAPTWASHTGTPRGGPLEGGLCGVYPHRPLACRGLLTQGDPRLCAPEAQAPKGHFLPVPWRMARLRMEALWEEERRRYGYTLIGELASLLYLLLKGLPEGKEAVEALLGELGVLGGRWGYQVI